jgi:hypothetical protein
MLGQSHCFQKGMCAHQADLTDGHSIKEAGDLPVRSWFGLPQQQHLQRLARNRRLGIEAAAPRPASRARWVRTTERWSATNCWLGARVSQDQALD